MWYTRPAIQQSEFLNTFFEFNTIQNLLNTRRILYYHVCGWALTIKGKISLVFKLSLF